MPSTRAKRTSCCVSGLFGGVAVGCSGLQWVAEGCSGLLQCCLLFGSPLLLFGRMSLMRISLAGLFLSPVCCSVL